MPLYQILALLGALLMCLGTPRPLRFLLGAIWIVYAIYLYHSPAGSPIPTHFLTT